MGIVFTSRTAAGDAAARQYGNRGLVVFFFSSRRRHTRLQGDWSSDVCSSDLQCLMRAERADLEGLDRQLEVVDRAGGTGEVEHAVERSLDLDEVGDVVQHELKIALVPQVSDVGRGARDEVVHPHDAMALHE